MKLICSRCKKRILIKPRFDDDFDQVFHKKCWKKEFPKGKYV